jgi:hypothetical protein
MGVGYLRPLAIVSILNMEATNVIKVGEGFILNFGCWSSIWDILKIVQI